MLEDALNVVIALFVLGGAAFALIAAIGVVRLPDVYTRMHAATKAGTLGAGLILIAGAFAAGEVGVVARAIACFIFLLLTAPVSGHLLGRAAYRTGVKLWDRTRIDELDGKYRPDGGLDGTRR